jgi:hypothetical protein
MYTFGLTPPPLLKQVYIIIIWEGDFPFSIAAKYTYISLAFTNKYLDNDSS